MTSKIKVDNIADQDDNNIINESGDVITVGASGDTVAVAGNIVKSNAYQASDGGNIVSQSGTTITIGASGDTISLASGASQSGFGREGSVDWQTSIKTGDFTAVSGEGYFVNTTSGTITMTLPSSPSAGDIVAVKDYANTFDTNKLTIGRNGQPLSGSTIDASLTTEGQALTLVYGDSTKGWQPVAAATEADLPKPTFVTATGGTITTSGNCKIHTFTGPGTFCVSVISDTPANNQVSYLVVGGGAGGGSDGGGGGGAGGYREDKSPVTPYTASPKEGAGTINATVTAFPITVGAGGAGGAKPSNVGSSGSVSTFSTITSAGGGFGGKFEGGSAVPGSNGSPGASGGGSAGIGPTSVNSGGTGNTPPVSPPQGSNGGSGQHIGGCTMTSGGGGGASGAGGNGTNQSPGPGSSVGGTGGTGTTSSITGSPLAYAGGGGGAGFENASGCGTSPCGTGGTGGGRAAAASSAGTANRGGGGGGGAHPGGGVNGGSAGGSGVVIIRYKFQ